MTSVNAWTNKTPCKISREDVDRTTPGNIGHSCGISETSSPALIGIIGTTAPLCDLNLSPEIDDIQQSDTPYFRDSNILDTSIDQQFTNNMVASPIFALFSW